MALDDRHEEQLSQYDFKNSCSYLLEYTVKEGETVGYTEKPGLGKVIVTLVMWSQEDVAHQGFGTNG